ncbi:TetR/AcrR family transcriptional regulator [Flavobacterium cellulosilyticum]|uniref:TetR/AcrR family transcriptional regulator n=1 Tax=Flavobacterium cellulosilyticum TaxID=2541731 RepID=A0A4R5CGX3_9FLAO|nr:TetR/AcrR family transcriptional regulator [Flavobacterium cellulosilyticum]TDD99418.1 TetR/AcrR family transcriptional regulator [Flavobacterium cellulosilyticum]
MKEKIISKAAELFLKLGFKSVTMDDIACEMCISKKTIYKYFCNKEVLIEQATVIVHENLHQIINTIISKKYNAIAENFEIRKMFKEMFQSTDTSPLYQLKKHYPEIYEKVMLRELNECHTVFKLNVEKGVEEGLYRKEINIENCIKFYYILIFSINENTMEKNVAVQLEIQALEYHTRAIATAKGIMELEKQLEIFSNN